MMAELQGLVTRLEQVTCRLESLAQGGGSGGAGQLPGELQLVRVVLVKLFLFVLL